MTTLSESIDAQIKSLQEQLNGSMKERKEEKTIDEQIKEIEEQMNGPQKEELTPIQRKEEIEGCLVAYHKEEKELLAKIEVKSTIIHYLTVELDVAKHQKEYLEKQLKDLRKWIIRTVREINN